MTDAKLLGEIVQALLALIIVGGGGFALVAVPGAPREALTGAIGAVVGYYFSRTAAANGYKNGIAATPTTSVYMQPPSTTNIETRKE